MNKGWLLETNEINRSQEITPVDDDQEHFSGPFCECDPYIDHLENKWTRIRHRSFDGREAVEMANDIINGDDESI